MIPLYIFDNVPSSSDPVLLNVERGEVLTDVLRRLHRGIETPCGGKGTCGKCVVSLFRASSLRSGESIESIYADLLREGKDGGSGIADRWETVLACRTPVEEPSIVLLPERTTVIDDPTLVGILGRTGRKETTGTGPFGVAVDLGTTTLVISLIDLSTGAVIGTAATMNPQSSFGADLMSRITAAQEDPGNIATLRDLLYQGVGESILRVTSECGVSPEKITLLVAAGNSVMTSFWTGGDPRPMGRKPFQPDRIDFPVLPSVSIFPFLPNVKILTVPILTGLIGGDLTAGIVTLSTIKRGKFSEKGFADFDRDSSELLIDIGTNGEILLFYRGEIYATSTAAGPVFEGASLSCGRKAVPGTIQAVDIASVPYWERESDGAIPGETTPPDLSAFPKPCPAALLRKFFHYRVLGNLRPVGICGSGLIDLIASLLRSGVISSKGRLVSAGLTPGDLVTNRSKDGRRFLFPLNENDSRNARGVKEGKGEIMEGTPLFLTQEDIRQVQLAVGAIRAGTSLLLEAAGISVTDLTRIHLAGGFGCSLRRENAVRIGLLPRRTPIERIDYLGNSSLTGSIDLLRFYHQRENVPPEEKPFSGMMTELRRRLVPVDLTSNPDFPRRFAESMIFPDD